MDGKCVPIDETSVTGTPPTPPPEPTGIEAFCSKPGNSGHEQCDSSSGIDGNSGTEGGSGGGSVGDESDNGSQEVSNNPDPNRPEKIQKAIDDALRCMPDPDGSEIARYQGTVRIEFGTIQQEGYVAEYYCEASYMVIDEARVNQAALVLGGHWRTIMLSVLIHELIHVDNHRTHGCPPWENSEFAPSNKEEEELYTRNRGFEEYERQTGRRSPFDPFYQRHHALIGCPSQQR